MSQPANPGDERFNGEINRNNRLYGAAFSTQNILVLGTMPGEIYAGYTEAAELVRKHKQAEGRL